MSRRLRPLRTQARGTRVARPEAQGGHHQVRRSGQKLYPNLGSHLVHLTYHIHIQDAEQELLQLAAKLRSQELSSVPAIAEGFRLAYALVLLRYMLH